MLSLARSCYGVDMLIYDISSPWLYVVVISHDDCGWGVLRPTQFVAQPTQIRAEHTDCGWQYAEKYNYVKENNSTVRLTDRVLKF